MKHTPIAFRGDSVRAILAGRKTETRRLVRYDANGTAKPCRYGGWGDRLWVKETWRIHSADEGTQHVEYRADTDGASERGRPWRPPRYMPRWASRIELEVVGVYRELLQRITEAGAIAEGFSGVAGFQEAWDEIYKNRGPYWADNPLVDVVKFRLIGAEE